jgi:hypothetical protein
VTASQKEAFGLALAALAANFRAELTEAQLWMTWLALKDELTLPQFEQAAARALRELEFYPNVGKLLELAGKGKRGPARKVRVIDGKPYTWLEGTGWGRYFGSVHEAQRSVGMEPSTSEELIKRIMPPAPPDRRLPREREDDDQ